MQVRLQSTDFFCAGRVHDRLRRYEAALRLLCTCIYLSRPARLTTYILTRPGVGQGRQGGVIDIVEAMSQDQIALRARPGCNQLAKPPQSGSTVGSDWSSGMDSAVGCANMDARANNVGRGHSPPSVQTSPLIWQRPAARSLSPRQASDPSSPLIANGVVRLTGQYVSSFLSCLVFGPTITRSFRTLLALSHVGRLLVGRRDGAVCSQPGG